MVWYQSQLTLYNKALLRIDYQGQSWLKPVAHIVQNGPTRTLLLELLRKGITGLRTDKQRAALNKVMRESFPDIHGKFCTRHHNYTICLARTMERGFNYATWMNIDKHGVEFNMDYLNPAKVLLLRSDLVWRNKYCVEAYNAFIDGKTTNELYARKGAYLLNARIKSLLGISDRVFSIADGKVVLNNKWTGDKDEIELAESRNSNWESALDYGMD